MTGENLNVSVERIGIFFIVSLITVFSWSYLATAFIQNDDPYLTISAAVVFSAMIMFATILLFAAILFCRKEEVER